VAVVEAKDPAAEAAALAAAKEPGLDPTTPFGDIARS
jgi:hypothetical protein